MKNISLPFFKLCYMGKKWMDYNCLRIHYILACTTLLWICCIIWCVFKHDFLHWKQAIVKETKTCHKRGSPLYLITMNYYG